MKRIFFFLLLGMNIANAQVRTPQLAYICSFELKVDAPLIVGETSHGVRRIIPIQGGIVQGPNIQGEVLNGGADWQLIRKDGVAEIEAHYQFKTNDGVLVYVKNIGVRIASVEVAANIAKGEYVDPSTYYFRTIPKFEAPAGKYDWLNDAIFVCSGERLPNIVKIHVWKLL